MEFSSDSDVDDLIRLVPELSDEDIASGINIETPFQPYLPGLDDSFSFDNTEELSNTKHLSMPSPDSIDKDRHVTGFPSVKLSSPTSQTDFNCATRFVLPASFFDIPSNLTHLTLCQPLYIKLIDFKKYPSSLNEECRKKNYSEAKVNNLIYYQKHLEEYKINKITEQCRPSDAKLHDIKTRDITNSESEDDYLLDDDDEVVEILSSPIKVASNAKYSLERSNEKLLRKNIFNPKRNTGIVGLKVANFNSFKSTLSRNLVDCQSRQDRTYLTQVVKNKIQSERTPIPTPVEKLSPHAYESKKTNCMPTEFIQATKKNEVQNDTFGNVNRDKGNEKIYCHGSMPQANPSLQVKSEPDVIEYHKANELYLRNEATFDEKPVKTEHGFIVKADYPNSVGKDNVLADSKKNKVNGNTSINYLNTSQAIKMNDAVKINENLSTLSKKTADEKVLLIKGSTFTKVKESLRHSSNLNESFKKFHKPDSVRVSNENDVPSYKNFVVDYSAVQDSNLISKAKRGDRALQFTNLSSKTTKKQLQNTNGDRYNLHSFKNRENSRSKHENDNNPHGNAFLEKKRTVAKVSISKHDMKSDVRVPYFNQAQSSNDVGKNKGSNAGTVIENGANNIHHSEYESSKTCINECLRPDILDPSKSSYPQIIKNEKTKVEISMYTKTETVDKIDTLLNDFENKKIKINPVSTQMCEAVMLKKNSVCSPTHDKTQCQSSEKKLEKPSTLHDACFYKTGPYSKTRTIGYTRKNIVTHLDHKFKNNVNKGENYKRCLTQLHRTKNVLSGEKVKSKSSSPTEPFHTHKKYIGTDALVEIRNRQTVKNTQCRHHKSQSISPEPSKLIKHNLITKTNPKGTENDEKAKHMHKNNKTASKTLSENSKSMSKQFKKNRFINNNVKQQSDKNSNTVKHEKSKATNKPNTVIKKMESSKETTSSVTSSKGFPIKTEKFCKNKCKVGDNKRHEKQTIATNYKHKMEIHENSFEKTKGIPNQFINENKTNKTASIEIKKATDQNSYFKSTACEKHLKEHGSLCNQAIRPLGEKPNEEQNSLLISETILDSQSSSTPSHCKKSMLPEIISDKKGNFNILNSSLDAEKETTKIKKIVSETKFKDLQSRTLAEQQIPLPNNDITIGDGRPENKLSEKGANNLEIGNTIDSCKSKHIDSYTYKEYRVGQRKYDPITNKNNCKVGGTEVNEKQTIATNCKHKKNVRENSFKNTKVIPNQSIDVNETNNTSSTEIKKAKHQNSDLNSIAREKPLKEHESLCDQSKIAMRPYGEKSNEAHNSLLMPETILDSQSISTQSHGKISMSPEIIVDKKGILNILNSSLDAEKETTKIKNFVAKTRYHKDSQPCTLAEEQIPLSNNKITICDDSLLEKKLSEKGVIDLDIENTHTVGVRVTQKNYDGITNHKLKNSSSLSLTHEVKRVDIQEGKASSSSLDNKASRFLESTKQLECAKSYVGCNENFKSTLENKINSNVQRKSNSNAALIASSSTTTQEIDKFYSPAVLSVEIFQKTVELIGHAQKKMLSKKRERNLDTQAIDVAKKPKKISLEEYKARKAM